MERIKELEKQRDDLRRLLTETREQIKQEYTRLAAEKFGVKPGSIVKNKDGRIFRVAEIDSPFIPWIEKPWLMACPRKKDGDFSKREQMVYRWELVE